MTTLQRLNKKCPYCAETIKAEAIVCRYCGRDLPSTEELGRRGREPTSPPLPTPDMITEQPLAAEVLPWDEVWLRALTSPSVTVFEGLLRDPQATTGRGYLWVFIGTFLALAARLLLALVVTLTPQLSALQKYGPLPLKPETLVWLLVASPFFAVFTLWLSTHITQWVATMFGGTGSYAELVYLRATYLAPITIIINVLNPIPIIGYLNLAVILYLLLLEVTAVKTVNRCGWGSAIASVFLPGMIVGFLLSCGLLGVGLLLLRAISFQ